jgi:predicted PurR-regulated permease PerM
VAHRGRDVLCEIGKTLQLLCIGQFTDMSVVTLLVGAGLFTLGVRLTPSLALFAGLLNFVPYGGALVGAVPGMLVAMAHSSTLALRVALLFVAAQTIEGAPLCRNV